MRFLAASNVTLDLPRILNQPRCAYRFRTMHGGTMHGGTGVMMKRLLIATVCVFPTAAGAVDMANYLKSPPSVDMATARGMYDVERCAVQVDGPSVASVYRQPDRPAEVTIVWAPGELGGISVVKLAGIEATNLKFWGRDKVWNRIKAACGF